MKKIKLGQIVCDIDRIEDDCFDSHQGETYCNLLAYNKDKLLIGFIDYSIFENEINVKGIEVRDVCRRKRIASKLLAKLEEKDYIVNIGYSTDDGTEFLRDYYKRKGKT